ncbi:hypothetical protein RclHR1_00150005 [Rhizophagus clarus]|uniref:HCP-like protein n=1 Tax=Rhizophagus clarus TaxID=94130 RepID=A0A2Z6QRF9_9GLOM|nr:hypothetical protein RclHR1_00150005 [Rhizophagus clarus]
MTYNNFDDKDNENKDNTTTIIEPVNSQNSIFSFKSNIVKYESSSFKFNITTNTEFKEGADILNVIINNFLLEYDLEPKNVLEIMTNIIINKKNNYNFYIKNAEKGDSTSQYYIGKYYYNKQDYNTAIEWYSKSSEGVGYYCSKGYGTLKDEIKAFEFYLKAAEKGHSSSQYLVANWYNNGKHVLRNEEKGFYWDRKAAINSNVDAQFELSKYYINSSINKNERKAFK